MANRRRAQHPLLDDLSMMCHQVRQIAKGKRSLSPLHDLRLAAFYAAAGNRAKSLEILSQIRDPMSPYENFHMASALAGMGSKEEALETLQTWKRKMSHRDEQLGYFRWWLRNDPNFKELRDGGDLDPFLIEKNGPSA